MAANTITGLVAVLYRALDTISRELTGAITAVGLNTVDKDNVTREAALNQTIRAAVVPQGSLENITPGQEPADTGEQTIGYTDMTMSNSKAYPIKWNGEEQLSLGSQAAKIMQDQIEQGLRTFANAIETDLAELYVYGSRAYGTPGTTPFASSLDGSVYSRKILDDNGAPFGLRSLVINTDAGANMRLLSNLSSADKAGDDTLLRQGTLTDIHGFGVKESAQIQAHTKGTGAGYLVDLVAGYAIGTTTFHIDTGTGTILAGDVITIGTDTNKYVVTSGTAGDGDDDITIAKPGLRVAAVNDVALTVGASYTANMAFTQNAILLATRAPKAPDDGDKAEYRIPIMDPRTGLTFSFTKWPGYYQNKYELGLVWGVKALKAENIAVLMG